MAGAILAISVLFTGSILPNVEARRFADTSSSGISINCRVTDDKAIPGNEILKCIFSDKDGIRFTKILRNSPISISDTNPSCFDDTRHAANSASVADVDGTWQISVRECGDTAKLTTFTLDIEGHKIILTGVTRS